MRYLKILGKSLLYMITITITLTFIITILSYFNILSDNTVKVFKLLSIIIGVFIGGFIAGKNTNNKGYIEGIKLGIIIILLLCILSLLLNCLNINSILYYTIIVISTIFGSMIGALKKVKAN